VAAVVEALTMAAAVVSALAALGALGFAWATVREARALRREERLARVPELISDVAAMSMRVAVHKSNPSELDIAQARLRAAITATGEPLPSSMVLTEIDLNPFNANKMAMQVIAALDEITERLTTPA
jgi:hypothetical protein